MLAAYMLTSVSQPAYQWLQPLPSSHLHPNHNLCTAKIIPSNLHQGPGRMYNIYMLSHGVRKQARVRTWSLLFSLSYAHPVAAAAADFAMPAAWPTLSTAAQAPASSILEKTRQKSTWQNSPNLPYFQFIKLV